MKDYYSLLKIILFLIITLGATSYIKSADWPVKQKIDLSSGFGDFRGGRFHAGVDLRTGGKIGRKVYAPVDGYIYRIKMSYRGYGKGLYLKGKDGYIYVFAHLFKFKREIGLAVRQAQYDSKRYYIDIELPPDSIPVKKGEFIARTGQSGVGAPHLHFEKRTAENKPLNPLSHGFEINDKVRPTFKRIGFQYSDQNSLFEGGKRKIFLSVKKGNKAGEYKLDSLLEFDGSFGIIADCFDQMRPGSMRQSVYRINLYIDGDELYRSQLDSLEFGIGSQVGLMFDPLEAANDERRVRRLFLSRGESYRLGQAFNEYGGRVSFDSELNVKHTAKIVATDNFGNHSELSFEFIFKKGKLKQGIIAFDQIIDFQVAEDGIVLSYINDSSTFESNYQFVDMEDADKITKVLDAINSSKSLNSKVAIVGRENSEKLNLDSEFSVVTGANNFFSPRIIAVRKISGFKNTQNVISDIYHIQPDGFAVKKEFEISLNLSQGNPKNKKAGLCWWDKKEKEWVWIDEDSLNSDLTSAGSIGGGIFTALIDSIPPKIRKLNISNGKIVHNLKPVIKFKLTDSLSGFEDDRSIDVRIDGQWLIPEYDFEDNSCKAFLFKPLKPGKKILTIKVKDRAGNITELKREFVVKKSKKKVSGKNQKRTKK